MVALTLSFVPEMQMRELRDITHAIKAVDERIACVYVRPRDEGASI